LENRLILASSSPRRIEILRKNGIEPRLFSPEVNEEVPGGMNVLQAVLYLALKKGLAAEKCCKKGMIIAADTIVFKDRIIGKPKDEAEAEEILMHLRNGKHSVITGVALIEAGTQKRKVFFEETAVYFKDYDIKMIRRYLTSGEAMDKAGGYAIQGEGRQFVDYIEGDFDNVVGFPWTRIKEELSKFGLRV
jgi:septum formation protein